MQSPIRQRTISAAIICFIAAIDVAAYAQTGDPHKPKLDQNKVVWQFAIPARQGVAVDRDYLYAISNTEIVKCEKRTGKVIATWTPDPQSPKHGHFLHLNSGTVIDTQLYCAHSRYPVAPNENTVEIWNVDGRKLEHVRTLAIPGKYGSLTWIDRRRDGTWWMCFARYGRPENENTTLVRYECKKHSGTASDTLQFIERKSWTFPAEVVRQWGTKSCSGGSWGPDGLLYTTGHDDSKAFVLTIDGAEGGKELSFVRTETDVGFFGQAIAWDRFSLEPLLWGIVKRKHVSATLIPAAAAKPKSAADE